MINLVKNKNLNIFEKSKTGNNDYIVENAGIAEGDIKNYIPESLIRDYDIGLPDLRENEAARYFTNLSKKNYGVDNGIYPLGSCTMKYNPKINEEISNFSSFTDIHPYQNAEDVQGSLMVYYELGEMLKKIVGLDAVTFHPSAGAHGEFCGLMIAKKYFSLKGENRNIILIPDSAHGTNFASASMAGFEVIEVKSGADGTIDLNELNRIVDEKKEQIAAVMVTNPNTLGIFEKNILKISEKMHKNGSFLYYDGANLNAIIGLARPGDMGFDIVHLNLHKTFSTPHGGGGPGAGPILVKDKLKTFLPAPVVAKDKEKYYLNYDLKNSIGKIKAFYGNFLVCLKAYCYLLSVGSNLRDISINAVLNANYLKKKLERLFEVPYDKNCMHEFVLSAKKYRDKGGSALHIAKRIIDYGIHPPTIYFPIIVEEAMMIEPTESEDIQQLDKLVNIFNMIIEELESNPEAVINAPVNTEIGKLDEIKALKEPILKY